MRNYFILFSLFLTVTFQLFSQGNPYYKGGFKVTFDSTEQKYIRFIAWTQFQVNMDDAPAQDESLVTMQLRRARFLAYGQLIENFLVITHFGINSLNGDNMQPVGATRTPQLFMHDAWVQYNVHPDHVVGGGLHYWNGLSRLNSQGTLNFLTMDNHRPTWSTLGLSDQFQRHIGIFGKGTFGKLQYQVSFNEAMTNSLDARPTMQNQAVYQGRKLLGHRQAGRTYGGYFIYNLLNVESNFLPYRVGSYLGAEKLLNIGAGFFAHPNGAVRLDDSNELIGEDVNLFALDVFYDHPVGENGASVTAYGLAQHNNYGTNYNFGPYASGWMFYGHVGYMLPGDFEHVRYQPYVSVGNQSLDFDGLTRNNFGAGLNVMISGHNAKLTLEYQNITFLDRADHRLSLQAMIYL
ncbi:MAG: hypothetical protein JJT77_12035 [Crocinitomicaceae bacterium]|nr:hypothetical protein [Crocinitomicaceae bacterium]